MRVARLQTPSTRQTSVDASHTASLRAGADYTRYHVREYICQRAAEDSNASSQAGRRLRASPLLDWQADTKCRVASARRERTRRREHVAARWLRRLLHLNTRGDGCWRVRGVCACARACLSVASWALQASTQFIRVWE